MKITFDINSISYISDTSDPYFISIPLIFNGEQPNTYNVNRASATAYESGEFIGDTRRGGGCNFEEYKLIPHCNGTHTECIGHISHERISINNTLNEFFIPATLITVSPEKAFDTNDDYIPSKSEADLIITENVLREKLTNTDADFLKAMIIRTSPNDISKKKREYMNDMPPFLSIEAMKYLSGLNTEHLLLDLPSVDRTFDEGKLTSHHIYWNVPLGSHDVDKENHSMKTITEMIYVPDYIPDGKYLLNIQIPDFVSDAAPSRVSIFKISRNK